MSCRGSSRLCYGLCARDLLQQAFSPRGGREGIFFPTHRRQTCSRCLVCSSLLTLLIAGDHARTRVRRRSTRGRDFCFLLGIFLRLQQGRKTNPAVQQQQQQQAATAAVTSKQQWTKQEGGRVGAGPPLCVHTRMYMEVFDYRNLSVKSWPSGASMGGWSGTRAAIDVSLPRHRGHH